jgi:1,4-alpha-glucan branching enzyme
MPLPQLHISPDTTMGANLVAGGGATFRVWAPRARAVHVVGDFNGWSRDDASLLMRHGDRWAGFVENAKDGDEYMFFVEGEASSGEKRDPYARELTPEWPQSHCVVRDPSRYRWRDAGFRTAPFHELVLYQLHVGAFDGPDRPHRVAKFLDTALRVEHLASLGINCVQLLPVVEFQTMYSLGYNGTDYFSPEMDYGIHDAAEVQRYLGRVNALFAKRGAAPVSLEEAAGAMNQLKVLIDLLHVWGIAVLLDVVYNHAGGDFDEKSIYFFDRQRDDSLYFSRDGWAGGLVFAFTKPEVRRFLIDNAVFWLTEFHFDGLRYDEVSVIDHIGHAWDFCQDLTRSVRHAKPEALQNAEYWPVNPWVVRAVGDGGAGFDATQHDALRIAVRDALREASFGMDARVRMHAVADALHLHGFTHPWQAVPCVENHDRVLLGRDDRIARVADGSNPRSWYARSRSRVAMALTFTAPGIPMLFMGQELLEDKQWSDTREPSTLVWWGGIDSGDRHVDDFVRFTSELLALRRRLPALRSARANILHVHDDTRVLAFQRDNVVVIASLNDSTFSRYRLPFPFPGEWREVFNSDAYDDYAANGNGGRVFVGEDHHAEIVIPANGVLVFTH